MKKDICVHLDFLWYNCMWRIFFAIHLFMIYKNLQILMKTCSYILYLCKHTYYTFDVDIELLISTTYFITSYLYSNQTTHAVSEELEHKLYK